MKLSPYMNINRIEFMVTYNCTGKCIHCSVADKLNSLKEHNHVREKEAVAAIEWLANHFDVTSVMTFGGEPLLYPEIVGVIHSTARNCRIEQRQLITNGYFSKQEERISQVACMLSSSGVNNLMLSVDVFHQETIPIDLVQLFARKVMEAGVPKVRLQPAWVVNKGHENPYNQRTKEILAQFTDLNMSIAGGNDIVLVGNAAKYLTQYYDAPKLNLSTVCGTMPYTEPLTNITSLSIVPNGDVLICSYVIGNIYEESIADIVARYNPYENDFMRAILTGGGAALLAVMREKGIAVDCEKCYSVCDLCGRINK